MSEASLGAAHDSCSILCNNQSSPSVRQRVLAELDGRGKRVCSGSSQATGNMVDTAQSLPISAGHNLRQEKPGFIRPNSVGQRATHGFLLPSEVKGRRGFRITWRFF